MMIKEPYGFIYITTNMINGKRYIGQKMFKGKWKCYLGSGIHLKRAIKKYGKENFYRAIIDIAYSKKDLDRLEKEWINNYNAVENEDFYNVAEGGEGGNTYAGKSREELKLIGKKISESNKGKLIGKKNPNYGVRRIKELNGMYGKHHSKYTKLKMSKCRKGMYEGNKNNFYGKQHSVETKKLISKLASRGNNPKAKKVQCATTGRIFNCMVDGAECYKIKNSTDIGACCRGRQKSAGKHPITGEKLIWKYLEDSE